MELEKVEVTYQAPVVEIIEVQVEKGFTASLNNDGNLGGFENDGSI